MVFTRKKKHQKKGLLSQLDESLNDFVIGSIFRGEEALNAMAENQNYEFLSNYSSNSPGENSRSHTPVTETNIANRVRDEVDGVVAAFENRVHDEIATVMDNVFILRVEMAVRSVTGLSGRGPSELFQHTDWRIF